MLGVEDRQPSSSLEGERVALEQGGAVLLTNVTLPVGVEDLPALRGDLPCGTGRMLEVLVDQIDVRLLDGQLAVERVGGCHS